MDMTDKRRISAIAQILIVALEQCDDDEFAAQVAECVYDCDPVPLEEMAKEAFDEAEAARKEED